MQIEKYTVTASVNGETATADFYMYNADQHGLDSIDTIEESGNTYCLFNHSIATYIETPSADVCAWKYGDDVTKIRTYTLEGNFDLPDMAEAIDVYNTDGSHRDMTNVVNCEYIESEE